MTDFYSDVVSGKTGLLLCCYKLLTKKSRYIDGDATF